MGFRAGSGSCGERGVSCVGFAFEDAGYSFFTVCCDGAADRYLASGRVPDRIVGDGDSLSVENQKRYASIIRYNPDQETNDQTKAVNYLMEKGFRRIAIVGATGRREDHTLGNISLLMEYMRMGAEVRMYTDYGFFVPMKGDCRFSVVREYRFRFLVSVRKAYVGKVWPILCAILPTGGKGH